MGYLDQMNVKANEQDTVGTDYDLRDKDLNAAADTTSVASTQSIVLKGTDGSYHKIDKQSFTEAVRGVLGGILNNMTSKGTAVKGVGVIDNSNDFGLTTPSDLATVLGATNVFGVRKLKTKKTDSSFSFSDGYGLWVLIDNTNTGGTALFSISYHVGSVYVISDEKNLIGSERSYTIEKDSVGGSFVVNNLHNYSTTIIKIG